MEAAIYTILLFAFQFSVFAQTNEEVLKVTTSFVSVPVTVSDRNNRYISGLKQEDFELFQDGVIQPISFFAAEEEPLNFALLIDSSKSTENSLGKIKDAAKDFVKLLLPNDKAIVVTFDFETNVLSELTSDQKILEKSIKKVKIGEFPGTVLRDAVRYVITKEFAKVKGRKAIILLTDGKDVQSDTTTPELINLAQESDTMIYSIFFKTNFDLRAMQGQRRPNRDRRGGVFGGNFPRPRENPQREERIRNRQKIIDEEAILFLEKLSEVSAGRTYQKEISDLKTTFSTITEELRKQYRLGYYPPDEDGKPIHHLKVKVRRENVVVRSRSVYRPK